MRIAARRRADWLMSHYKFDGRRRQICLEGAQLEVVEIGKGEPIVLVQDGRPIERNLRRERVTLEEVQEEARRSQIASLADLQWAILEDDGHISCIPRRD